MRILCPNCGTITATTNPFATCTRCKKRLPLTLPRNAIYLTRTYWRAALILALIALLAYISPRF